MTTLTRLCKVEDVQPETPLGVTPEGFPPLAVFGLEDGYYVTSDICTHGQALLSEGFQEGPLIECPFHAGAFDIRTGEAVRFPCLEPVKIYKVVVEDGWIHIAK